MIETITKVGSRFTVKLSCGLTLTNVSATDLLSQRAIRARAVEQRVLLPRVPRAEWEAALQAAFSHTTHEEGDALTAAIVAFVKSAEWRIEGENWVAVSSGELRASLKPASRAEVTAAIAALGGIAGHAPNGKKRIVKFRKEAL